MKFHFFLAGMILRQESFKGGLFHSKNFLPLAMSSQISQAPVLNVPAMTVVPFNDGLRTMRSVDFYTTFLREDMESQSPSLGHFAIVECLIRCVSNQQFFDSEENVNEVRPAANYGLLIGIIPSGDVRGGVYPLSSPLLIHRGE